METEEEYLTLKEVAGLVGVQRGSLYYYIDRLAIKTRRFPLNKHSYMARADVCRIVQAKKRPWLGQVPLAPIPGGERVEK